MSSVDPKLGHEVWKMLSAKQLLGCANSQYQLAVSAKGAEKAVTKLLDAIGCVGHSKCPSMHKTPQRAAKMWLEELSYGLDFSNFPALQFSPIAHRCEMVTARNIKVQSYCEHHLLPFIGTAVVSYIPKDRVLGLSKCNRIVDFFARRPQLQERLTLQIREALAYVLQTEDVGVYIKADHFCVKMRGVCDPCSETITTALGGAYIESDRTRNEFMLICNS